MIFKFIEKKIAIDCFTYDELVLQTAPVSHAIKHIPDWWKNLPNHYYSNQDFFPTATVRSCSGIVDYYKKSLAIPLWSDLSIKVDGGSYGWAFSDLKTVANIHDIQKQATGLLPDHGHIKIQSPWFFKAKEDISWVWSQPIYSFEEANVDIKVLPAIVNFKQQQSTDINLLIPLNQQKTYTVNHGQVLCHLTPMTDKNVIIERHLISKESFMQMAELNTSITFLNKLANVVAKKEKFADCPYKKLKGKL
jgi:hypothetical protein